MGRPHRDAHPCHAFDAQGHERSRLRAFPARVPAGRAARVVQLRRRRRHDRVADPRYDLARLENCVGAAVAPVDEADPVDAVGDALELGDLDQRLLVEQKGMEVAGYSRCGSRFSTDFPRTLQRF